MRATVSLALASALMTVLCGCAGRPADKPFHVAVQGSGVLCSIEAGGRVVTVEALEAIARRVVKSTQRARIIGDPATPYRCIGGVIYALQKAGFTHVDATSMWPRRR